MVTKMNEAVLLLLESGPKTPEQMTFAMNKWLDFADLRAKWGGSVTRDQVYAAMSGLRKKHNPSRCAITPEGGEPSISKPYAITPFGRREIERLKLTPLKQPPPIKTNLPERDRSVAWWPVDALFGLGDKVQKKGRASWRGTIVGWYRTELTALGYAVESSFEPGSVQIYPESALLPWDA